MKRKLLLMGFVALALALLWSGVATAGTTGKINGVAKDAKGAPLPGASVVIEGTKQGAVTDVNGYYVVLNISPGTYRLTASLIGYDKVTKSSVNITVDQTTTLDFNLKETAVQMSEVTVVAERPLVEMDKTTSKYVMSANEIEKIGVVRSTQDLLQLQPGVSVDGSNRIRGSFQEGAGYGVDVAYVVDGVRINYNDGRGKGGSFQSVNRGAVQEIAVLTGVTPAEYGNAQGGVVNIVTKDGENKYHGWGEGRFQPASQQHWGENVYDAPFHLDKIKWKDASWTNERNPATGKLIHQRTDYTRWTGWQGEGNISGPVGERASFVVTLKHDQLAPQYPGPTRYGFYDEMNRWVPSGPDNLTMSGSFTVKPSNNLKLKAGGLLQWWKYYSDGRDDIYGSGTGTIQLLPGVVRGLGDSGRDLFLPENWSAAGQQTAREELQYAVLTHTISPKTFYEVRLARSRSLIDSVGTHGMSTTLNTQDSEKWFNLGMKSANRSKLYDRQRYTAKVDISSQVTKGNFVKAGVEFVRGNMWYTQFVDSDPAERRIYFYSDKGQLGKAVHPTSLNVYAQDKMEFQGMIVNLGVRMDAFSPNVRTNQHGAYMGAPMFRVFTRAQDYMYDEQSLWSLQAPWQFLFSPRLGISHPITSRAQIRFSSGVFMQFPDMFYYYGKDYRSFGKSTDLDVNANGRIDETEKWNNMETTYSGLNGDPLLRPAKSTNFEVGMDWNFVSDYTAALTTYYKSEVDQYTTYPNENWHGVKDRGVIYARTLDNGAYADTRGVELALKKAFSHNFAFQVSYNMQWTVFATGKVGNVLRDIFQDSAGVASLAKTGYTKTFADGQSVFVPDLWVDFDPSPSGREIPRKMTDADIAKYGAGAQSLLNGNIGSRKKYAELGPGFWDGFFPLSGPLGARGVYISTGGYIAGALDPKPGEHRSFGSLTLLMSMPDQFKFGPGFMGNLLSNLRATLINKIETGSLFMYTPPQGGSPSWRERMMDSRTDLAVEKTFLPKGRFQPTFFVDVRNLFNQKDRTGPPNSTDYTYWGLENPRPDDTNYVKYGDVNDRNFAAFPRRWNMGMRFNW